ncbi:hypothetical protein [Actinomadura algeriensis]|uniref:Alkanesulfonate monooxygenase SsuD/methylene tetrahydromethanopterin reductase-like flavin-dependent oxidoreductase (Luciferase family) n=1 Tax=Actinomadura algeriensis TaxID=1679523 RepID=A0ABR9K248_9ACTN|nr:hypothetical protein [Actinomadura algeriensis]MBE1536921.1 alkanesulfonate monooxygenase SsuD/methylene tetrahydromethanopterin reductase-like flavin-dependent oxidoreductase (luciferase family) [Actinomadura algeriensis]
MAEAQHAERLGVGTAATDHNTRHPLVDPTLATITHRLCQRRHAFGLGRGFDALFAESLSGESWCLAEVDLEVVG